MTVLNLFLLRFFHFIIVSILEVHTYCGVIGLDNSAALNVMRIVDLISACIKLLDFTLFKIYLSLPFERVRVETVDIRRAGVVVIDVEIFQYPPLLFGIGSSPFSPLMATFACWHRRIRRYPNILFFSGCLNSVQIAEGFW